MAGCMRYCSSSSTLCTPASSRRLNSGTSRPSLRAVRCGAHTHACWAPGQTESSWADSEEVQVQVQVLAQGLAQALAQAAGLPHAGTKCSLDCLLREHRGRQLLLVACSTTSARHSVCMVDLFVRAAFGQSEHKHGTASRPAHLPSPRTLHP